MIRFRRAVRTRPGVRVWQPDGGLGHLRPRCTPADRPHTTRCFHRKQATTCPAAGGCPRTEERARTSLYDTPSRHIRVFLVVPAPPHDLREAHRALSASHRHSRQMILSLHAGGMPAVAWSVGVWVPGGRWMAGPVVGQGVGVVLAGGCGGGAVAPLARWCWVLLLGWRPCPGRAVALCPGRWWGPRDARTR